MNNLNRLVILVVLIGLLYLLYVYQEQVTTEPQNNEVIVDSEEEKSQSSEASLGSLTIGSSDLTMNASNGNDLDSTYDSDISDDEAEEDGLNFQLAE